MGSGSDGSICTTQRQPLVPGMGWCGLASKAVVIRVAPPAGKAWLLLVAILLTLAVTLIGVMLVASTPDGVELFRRADRTAM
jgi:hypothetical protein